MIRGTFFFFSGVFFFFFDLFGIWHPRWIPLSFFCLVGAGRKAAFGPGNTGSLQIKINQIMSCMNNGDGKMGGRVEWKMETHEYPR